MSNNSHPINVPQVRKIERLKLQPAWPAQQDPDFITVSDELADEVASVGRGIDDFQNACANTKNQSF
jgi:hypothetical protein